MSRYSDERRMAVVAKLLPPYNLSVAEVASQENISTATIYKWRKEARTEGRCLPDSSDPRVEGWSSRDKFAAVVETASMNTEEVAAYCRQRGIYSDQLKRWRHDCEQAASLSYEEQRQEADLTKQQRKRIQELERELRRKNDALAETAALLALSKKVQAIWGGRGVMISIQDRRNAVLLIHQARAAGASLAKSCEVMGISIRTHQRWTQMGEVTEDQRPHADRPTPANALTAEEEAEILAQCHRQEFIDLPPDQIVVRLMDEEQRYIASPSSFYRVLRKHNQLAHRGRSKSRKKKTIPTTHHATAPNQVWSWDCTWLPGPVKGTYYYLVMIIDVFSRKIVGWEAFLSESAENSRTVIERAMLSEKMVGKPLVLHADNGSPFKGATLLEKLHDLQIQPSFSRPRVSNDNAYSEALFRTCKYMPDFPAHGFEGLKQAQCWVHGFVRWYNHEHHHSAIRFVTPVQRHTGEEVSVLSRRHAITQAARQANPERWSGQTRNWNRIMEVTLNPEHQEPAEAAQSAA